MATSVYIVPACNPDPHDLEMDLGHRGRSFLDKVAGQIEGSVCILHAPSDTLVCRGVDHLAEQLTVSATHPFLGLASPAVWDEAAWRALTRDPSTVVCVVSRDLVFDVFTRVGGAAASYPRSLCARTVIRWAVVSGTEGVVHEHGRSLERVFGDLSSG